MRTPVTCGFAALATLLLSACAHEAPLSPVDQVELGVSASKSRGSARCVNVSWEGTFDLGFPVILPAYVGVPDGVPPAGALPTPMQLGPFTGMMSSVLVSTQGNVFKADHLTLIHYFVEDGTGDDFWTLDKAVCAPAGRDPLSCRINDALEIVGGNGKFDNANGKLRNHGTITITDPTFSESPYGSIDAEIRGRVCGDGL